MQELLENEFGFLIEEHGFVLSDEKYGGLVVAFKNNDLAVEFTQDRSDFFVNIKANKGGVGYRDIYDVLDEMRVAGVIRETYSPNNRINLAKKVLRLHLSQIQEFLGKDVA